MNSREKVLAAVSKNQPSPRTLPSLANLNAIRFEDTKAKFISVVEAIGGRVEEVSGYEEIAAFIPTHFTEGSQYITTIQALTGIDKLSTGDEPHTLENLEVAVIPGLFGVAENGAVWITEEQAGIRVLPFICQHLAIVLKAQDIVDNMHLAYEKIGAENYHFGVFIAGPSKTADIEQSLVLGAHGPRSLVVFLMGERGQGI